MNQGQEQLLSPVRPMATLNRTWMKRLSGHVRTVKPIESRYAAPCSLSNYSVIVNFSFSLAIFILVRSSSPLQDERRRCGPVQHHLLLSILNDLFNKESPPSSRPDGRLLITVSYPWQKILVTKQNKHVLPACCLLSDAMQLIGI